MNLETRGTPGMSIILIVIINMMPVYQNISLKLKNNLNDKNPHETNTEIRYKEKNRKLYVLKYTE